MAGRGVLAGHGGMARRGVMAGWGVISRGMT